MSVSLVFYLECVAICIKVNLFATNEYLTELTCPVMCWYEKQTVKHDFTSIVIRKYSQPESQILYIP